MRNVNVTLKKGCVFGVVKIVLGLICIIIAFQVLSFAWENKNDLVKQSSYQLEQMKSDWAEGKQNAK